MPYLFEYNKLCGQGKYAQTVGGGGTTTSGVNYEELENIAETQITPIRFKILLGKLGKNNQATTESTPSTDRSRFSCERYKFFLGSPFEISSECCKVMKKGPVHEYAKKTGRKPMTAQMASESRLRTQQWMKNGCNGFDMKNPISNPMSFWTDQDVLAYIKLYGKEMVKQREKSSSIYMIYGNRFVSRKTGATINNKELGNPICSVYGDIVTDFSAMGQVDGQMDFNDYGIFDFERPLLKTTGCDRTGCMFCGYGCHLEKSPGRFERMKITHPKIYEYIMKPWSDGGLGYKEVIDWINDYGNLNIRY